MGVSGITISSTINPLFGGLVLSGHHSCSLLGFSTHFISLCCALHHKVAATDSVDM